MNACIASATLTGSESGIIFLRKTLTRTFAGAKGGGDAIGPTKRGKGVKILAIVDRHGLPLSVSTDAANHHEVTLVQLSFDFYMIEAKPEHLIGDKAYDWLHWKRRLVTRWEDYSSNFLGFVELASITILLKRF